MRSWMLPIIPLLAVSVLFVREQSQAEDNPKERSQMLKAVVHVNFSDPERQGHGLKNVANILKEVGNDAEIEVVAHGAGIILLVQGESTHADKIQSLIQGRSLFEDVGDGRRDTMIAARTKGSALVAALNHLDCDTMTVGNHEPDFGREGMKTLITQGWFKDKSNVTQQPLG